MFINLIKVWRLLLTDNNMPLSTEFPRTVPNEACHYGDLIVADQYFSNLTRPMLEKFVYDENSQIEFCVPQNDVETARYVLQCLYEEMQNVSHY